jgi:hypothetical protein
MEQQEVHRALHQAHKASLLFLLQVVAVEVVLMVLVLVA